MSSVVSSLYPQDQVNAFRTKENTSLFCSLRLGKRAREAEDKRKDAVSRLERAEEEVAELRGRLVYAQALEVNRKQMLVYASVW